MDSNFIKEFACVTLFGEPAADPRKWSKIGKDDNVLASRQERTRQNTHITSYLRGKKWIRYGEGGLPKMSGIIFSNNKKGILSLIIVPNLFITLSWSNVLFKDGSGKWPMR